ncbi:hypothetical protein IE077_001459 [Cardiosporidium cionae]|uniref:Uncharacterized protein n=1 Tax=Cardiosporidium cionae TaxID=476202 RepID=A0ABQ7JCZ7_9APIC|nr:hypothetical protein IE077_001459 [Cardiosporidium cionae]|eukprot:KAF8821859.1 hypothetical protein IE077_001459 [Cardiosporidium cionae]
MLNRSAISFSLDNSLSKIGTANYKKLNPYTVSDETDNLEKISPTSEISEVPLNVAFCTLGVRYPGSSFMNEMEKVERDYVIKFARLCKDVGVKHMNLLSGYAANPQSRIRSSAIKGEAITALEQMGFERLSVFKPALVISNTETETISERINRILHPIISEFLPIGWRHVFLEDLVKAILLNVETCESDPIEHLTFLDFMSIVGKTPPVMK